MIKKSLQMKTLKFTWEKKQEKNPKSNNNIATILRPIMAGDG